MEKEYKMSAARAQELQEELNYLKTTRSDEVAEQIKVARGFGDLSENSEYDEAKNEQGKLYSRIAELEEILQHVVIVDEANAPTNVVTIGCKVTVADKNGKELPAYKIVGSQEADPMHGIISEESPFGKALWRLPRAPSCTRCARSSGKERKRCLNKRPISSPSRT